MLDVTGAAVDHIDDSVYGDVTGVTNPAVPDPVHPGRDFIRRARPVQTPDGAGAGRYDLTLLCREGARPGRDRSFGPSPNPPFQGGKSNALPLKEGWSQPVRQAVSYRAN
jgi:hypothetical protein